MALVELGRPVQRHLRPDRGQVRGPARCGATARTPPAARRWTRSATRSSGRRRRAARPRRTCRGPPRPCRPARSNSDSTSPATSSRSAGSGGAGPEHRPHRVADGGVQLAQPGRVGLLGHARSILSSAVDDLVGRRLAGADAGRDADPVVAGAGQRERGVRGAQRRPRGGHPVEVPGGVLRQRAAPPLHVPVDRRRQRRAEQPPTARRCTVAARSSSVSWSAVLLAVPADRGADQRQPVRPAQVPPLGGEERGRLDSSALGRPAPGSRTARGSAGRGQRQGDQRDAGVVERADRRRPPPAPTPASSRAAGRAGTASTTASDVDELRRRGSGRRASRQPVAGAASARGPRRPSGSSRRWPRPPPRPAAQPAGQGAKTGAPGGARRGGLRGPDRADQRVLRAGRAGQRRHRGDQRQVVGPAGVDPAEQRVDQPVHHLVAEPRAGPARRPRRPRPAPSSGRPASRSASAAGRGHRRHRRPDPRVRRPACRPASGAARRRRRARPARRSGARAASASPSRRASVTAARLGRRPGRASGTTRPRTPPAGRPARRCAACRRARRTARTR